MNVMPTRQQRDRVGCPVEGSARRPGTELTLETRRRRCLMSTGPHPVAANEVAAQGEDAMQADTQDSTTGTIQLRSQPFFFASILPVHIVVNVSTNPTEKSESTEDQHPSVHNLLGERNPCSKSESTSGVRRKAAVVKLAAHQEDPRDTCEDRLVGRLALKIWRHGSPSPTSPADSCP